MSNQPFIDLPNQYLNVKRLDDQQLKDKFLELIKNKDRVKLALFFSQLFSEPSRMDDFKSNFLMDLYDQWKEQGTLDQNMFVLMESIRGLVDNASTYVGLLYAVLIKFYISAKTLMLPETALVDEIHEICNDMSSKYVFDIVDLQEA